MNKQKGTNVPYVLFSLNILDNPPKILFNLIFLSYSLQSKVGVYISIIRTNFYLGMRVSCLGRNNNLGSVLGRLEGEGEPDAATPSSDVDHLSR